MFENLWWISFQKTRKGKDFTYPDSFMLYLHLSSLEYMIQAHKSLYIKINQSRKGSDACSFPLGGRGLDWTFKFPREREI